MIANARFTGSRISIEQVRRALRDLFAIQDRQISIDNIQRTTAEYFNIKIDIKDEEEIDSVGGMLFYIANKIPTGVEGWSPESGDTSRSSAPYKIYNIGNHNTVELGTFIETIEKVLGKTADKRYLDMQPGDVLATYANVDDLIADVDFAPNTSLEVGLEKFVRWYHEFYKV